MAKTLLVICFFFPATMLAQSTIGKQKAYALAKQSIQLMDEGLYQQSILLLEEAEQLDPQNIVYPYEKAYAYYNLKEYEKALDLLVHIKEHKEADARCYQLLGNSYKMLGDEKKAIKTYNKGLSLFPEAGNLYMELGNFAAQKEDYHKAVEFWEAGIKADPAFAGNYYWLAKVFSFTEEKLWTILYGEIFMNLEQSSIRTAEMSYLLYHAYKNAVHITSDSSGSINFSMHKYVNLSTKSKTTFSHAFNTVMTMVLPNSGLANDSEVSIASLHTLRTEFIKTWYASDWTQQFPHVLFNFMLELQQAEQLEAYNYWLLKKGREEEFTKWHQDHTSQYQAFTSWYRENPLKISKNYYFVRPQY